MNMMEEFTFFLRLQIKQTKKQISITESKYTRELLKRFGMESSKVIGTPMSPSCKLNKDEGDKNIDSKLYRGMIGSLLYLTASKPDIMFSVCLCACFQSNLQESYLNTVKIFLNI